MKHLLVLCSFLLATLAGLMAQEINLPGLKTHLQGSQPLLSWEASGRENWRSFELYRMTDDAPAERVALFDVQPGLAATVYRFLDRHASPGLLHHFRLSGTAWNGRVYDSPWVEIQAEPELLRFGRLLVHPYSSQAILLEVDAWKPCKVKVAVINGHGAELFQATAQLEAGAQDLTIGTPALPSGMYHLRLETRECIAYRSFVLK